MFEQPLQGRHILRHFGKRLRRDLTNRWLDAPQGRK